MTTKATKAKQLQELIILMVDCETTSLYPARGKAHQLGLHAVVTNGKETKTLLRENYLLPTTLEDWDPATLEWAKKKIPDAIAATLAPPANPWAERGPTVRAAAGELSRLASQGRQVVVVAQHPEFDLPFFEKEGIFLRDLFGHRNVYDLASLLVGAVRNEPTIRGLQRQFKGDHTALGDCIAQMNQLKAANYAGLLTYYNVRQPLPF